jgi:hypothetical protein
MNQCYLIFFPWQENMYLSKFFWVFFSMSNCTGTNFTREEAYYVSKIYSEDKTWAWWLNNLGKNFLMYPLISICVFCFRYISCFCHWFLWKYIMFTCSLSST